MEKYKHKKPITIVCVLCSVLLSVGTIPYCVGRLLNYIGIKLGYVLFTRTTFDMWLLGISVLLLLTFASISIFAFYKMLTKEKGYWWGHKWKISSKGLKWEVPSERSKR